jgi:hypothetical protein
LKHKNQGQEVGLVGKQGESVGDEREGKTHKKQLIIAYQKLKSNLSFVLGPTYIKKRGWC